MTGLSPTGRWEAHSTGKAAAAAAAAGTTREFDVLSAVRQCGPPPPNPQAVYRAEFISWADFLGLEHDTPPVWA